MGAENGRKSSIYLLILRTVLEYETLDDGASFSGKKVFYKCLKTHCNIRVEFRLTYSQPSVPSDSVSADSANYRFFFFFFPTTDSIKIFEKEFQKVPKGKT